jgi:hypothetical protein
VNNVGRTQEYEIDIIKNVGTISGIVLDGLTHNPIKNAKVSVYKGSVVVTATLTGTDGKYKVIVSEGTYKIRAEKSGYVPSDFETVDMKKDKDTQVNFNLFKTGTNKGILVVKVVDENDNPIDGASVNVKGKTYKTNESGYVAITLDKGTYTITVAKEGFESAQQSVTVKPGKTKEIKIILHLKSAKFAYWWLIPIIVGILVAVILVSAIIASRKKKKMPPQYQYPYPYQYPYQHQYSYPYQYSYPPQTPQTQTEQTQYR